VFDVWEMPLVVPDWTVMALDKFLSHPDVSRTAEAEDARAKKQRV
jgi:hypothetical protein